MNRTFGFGIALLLICGHPLNAANREDIEFRLHLVKDTRAYHVGEPIELKIVSERKEISDKLELIS